MVKVGVLIDFDNIFPKLISEYTNNEIDHAITNVINKVKTGLSYSGYDRY